MNAAAVRVAAFDLDDTVLRGDSQHLFVRYLVGKRLAPASLLAEVAFWFALHRVGVALEVPRLYARVIARCSGIDPAVLAGAMQDFATTQLAPRVRGDARAWIARVRAEGCHVVLLSASLDPIVAVAAAGLQADGHAGTRLRVAGTGRIDLDGEMVYAEAKMRTLQAYADRRFPSWRLEYAFGNDYGDRFLLEAAAHPVAVCASARLRAVARQAGWPSVTWR